MNEEQIDLIRLIIGEMIRPMEVLLTTNEYDDIINDNGGKFLAIFVSIMSSVLATSVNNFVKYNDIPDHKFLSEYEKILGIVSLEALEASTNRLKKGRMH
jgi:hypothetical protein